jgi:hypothetical protein
VKTYLEPDEIQRLEDAARYLRNRLLIRLLFRLGCRISEVLGIAVDDIDFNRGTATIEHLKVRVKLSCPECAARLSKTSRFCPGCGVKVEKAVAEEKAPLILQVSKGAREYASNSYLTAIMNVAVKENPDIPIATHLDHGDNFETCKQFVDDGFTSVMVDGSRLTLEENIAVTRKVVEMSHPRVAVEAELGAVMGHEMTHGRPAPEEGQAGQDESQGRQRDVQ